MRWSHDGHRMNQRKAKALRRAVRDRYLDGHIGRNLFQQVPIFRKTTNSRGGKNEYVHSTVAFWTGMRREYKLAKRTTQKGRPMPRPAGWVFDGLKRGYISPGGGFAIGQQAKG